MTTITREYSSKTRKQWHTPIMRPEGCLAPVEAAEFIGETIERLNGWRNKRRPCGPAFTKIGTKVFYRIETLRRWMRQRSEVAQ